MKQTGHADLPLHSGTVPRWLADRMMRIGTLIVESLIMEYGKNEVLVRLSDPLWFQAFGSVMGMDWHSSGITTSVMYALKRGINPRAKELGLCVCGGRGRYSRKTPDELRYISSAAGLDSTSLVRSSRLCAKIDSAAVQDGFQLYQHNFILSDEGSWAVVQQGMNTSEKKARRYHWSSANLRSFVDNPHTAVVGENIGPILNLTDSAAEKTRSSILQISREKPQMILKEIQLPGFQKETADRQLSFEDFENQEEILPPCRNDDSRSVIMPNRHNVEAKDIDLKRLGAVLAVAYTSQPKDFESLILTEGLGPRTLQALTLVSEIIYGTPSRFTDPARFSFAHGGKDGHPFPVPLKIYDESIQVLQNSIELSKLGFTEKRDCLNKLYTTAVEIEKNNAPSADFDKTLRFEKEHSAAWGGRTVSCG